MASMKNDDKISSIGRLLRKLRELEDLTQESLSTICGIPLDTIKKIEVGATKMPRRETAIALSNGLNKGEKGIKLEATLFRDQQKANELLYQLETSRPGSNSTSVKFDESNAPSRAQFYQAQAAARIYDWELDPHWNVFDENVELCIAPNLLEPDTRAREGGWTANEFILRNIGELERAPVLNDYYSLWRSKTDPHKLKKDGDKYSLANHPSSETDEHFVRLMLKSTKWSHVQAFLKQKKEASNTQLLYQIADPHYNLTSKPVMNFTASRVPHSICLHGIVTTTDNKVLAIKRPEPSRTDYYPLSWSLSFEEQLAREDFNDEDEVDATRWIKRSLRQEVLSDCVESHFNIEKARILAVVNEVATYNPFVVAYLPVECDSRFLSQTLIHAPDRAEWMTHQYYDIDFPCESLVKMFTEKLSSDGCILHPTTRYRIFLLLQTLFSGSEINIPSFLLAKQNKFVV